jgi:hypothetical protein
MAEATTSFDLRSFMSKNKDFARGYTFYATISNAPIAGLNESDKRYLVKTSSLPVGTVNPIETNWQGNKYKLGGVQEFTDFTIGFNIDPKKDNVRTQFVQWQNIVHNPQTNMHGNPDEYMADLKLEHLSHLDGSIIAVYQLIKAWPTTVSEVSLDYAGAEVATFDVTFAYQYHTIDEK